MKHAYGPLGSESYQRSTWIMWANEVVRDLPHLTRKLTFDPPVEGGEEGWVKARLLAERNRRPRTKLKPSESAFLIDVGDYMLELRATEAGNAAQLECLLHAAWLLWDANGGQANSGASAIYSHVLDSWGLMPPPVEDLDQDRRKRMWLCVHLVRETDLVPSWFMEGLPMPGHLMSKPKPTVVKDEEIDPAGNVSVGDMFDD